MKNFNICKQNGLVWYGFKMPVNAIFGKDDDGLFVDTHINYSDKIIYRQKKNGKWYRSIELNATTKKCDELTRKLLLVYKPCHSSSSAKKHYENECHKLAKSTVVDRKIPQPMQKGIYSSNNIVSEDVKPDTRANYYIGSTMDTKKLHYKAYSVHN